VSTHRRDVGVSCTVTRFRSPDADDPVNTAGMTQTPCDVAARPAGNRSARRPDLVDHFAGLDEPDYPWWSRALRQLRRRFDLSQRQLAERACLPASTVGDLELGRSVPSVRLLEIVLAAVGYRLVLTDCDGEPLRWSLADDSQPRDLAGRRYPAHLDVRPRYPGRVDHASGCDLEPPWTYHLSRPRRDVFRIGGRFGEWGAGPPSPAQFDLQYVRDVLGDEHAALLEHDPLDWQLRYEFIRRSVMQDRRRRSASRARPMLGRQSVGRNEPGPMNARAPNARRAKDVGG
jgi:transcriptional regulator with XRE-family HTH domain